LYTPPPPLPPNQKFTKKHAANTTISLVRFTVGVVVGVVEIVLSLIIAIMMRGLVLLLLLSITSARVRILACMHDGRWGFS
jgi:uncharacterized membrane protein